MQINHIKQNTNQASFSRGNRKYSLYGQ